VDLEQEQAVLRVEQATAPTVVRSFQEFRRVDRAIGQDASQRRA
jgi:hypothetical protein